jgi:ATPase subunit of ABC transporter with duplicated ATPase domains
MDIETIDVLAQALAEFTGTLIVVSHNRHFIEAFATKILYFSQNNGIQLYKGKYHDFVAQGMLDE